MTFTANFIWWRQEVSTKLGSYVLFFTSGLGAPSKPNRNKLRALPYTAVLGGLLLYVHGQKADVVIASIRDYGAKSKIGHETGTSCQRVMFQKEFIEAARGTLQIRFTPEGELFQYPTRRTNARQLLEI